jgi:hypothetical protein
MRHKVFFSYSLLAYLAFSHASTATAGAEDGIALPKGKLSFCLALRTHDHECLRKNRGSRWDCTTRPPLGGYDEATCLSWDLDAVMKCNAKYGVGVYQFPHHEAGTGFNNEYRAVSGMNDLPYCRQSYVMPEPETAPVLAPKFANAQEFSLPKEKFPECLVARIRTHECIRKTETDDWTCIARPTLRDPTAQCLTWFAPPAKKETRLTDVVPSIYTFVNYGICAGHPFSILPVHRYTTINIDPSTHRVEPVLRCEDTFQVPLGNTVYTDGNRSIPLMNAPSEVDFQQNMGEK